MMSLLERAEWRASWIKRLDNTRVKWHCDECGWKGLDLTVHEVDQAHDQASAQQGVSCSGRRITCGQRH